MKPRACIIALLLAVLLLPPGVSVRAQNAGPRDPAMQKWLAVFEQSYGTEGLYVLELHPTDPAGNSRLNIQLLNAAAQQFQSEHRGEIVTYEAVTSGSGAPELLPAAEGERYSWNMASGIFESSAGEAASAERGAMLLLKGNEAIRRRLVNPDAFTRERWKKIYGDAGAPEFLKREIVLREFMLEHYFFKESLFAESLVKQLAYIKDASELYALNRQSEPGDPVSVEILAKAGLLPRLARIPANVTIEFSEVGKDPVGRFGVYTVTSDPASVTEMRRRHAEEQAAKYPGFPPAMALRARFQPPAEAVKSISEAITAWPEVPGLRVERLAHEARRQNFSAWTPDLDFILTRFPAAPLLIEIEIAAEAGHLSRSPKVQAQIATIMADVRPDLLTQQLYALRVLQETGDAEAARSVYDRLAYSNPAWRVVLPAPAAATPSP